MNPTQRDQNSPKSAGLRPVIVVGAVLIALCALAIGISRASSTDPEQEKFALASQLAATHEAELLQASEHPELIPSRHPTTMPTIAPTSWSVGIVDTGLAPKPGSEYLGENGWTWDLDGNHVQVYAGAEGPGTANPGRGVIWVSVVSMSLEPVTGLGGWYDAPAGVGALRVASYQGTLLTIHAETGETFYFDANTRAFADADGNPVPTDTPTPTPTPEPSPLWTLPPDLFPTDTPPAGTASAVPAPSN